MSKQIISSMLVACFVGAGFFVTQSQVPTPEEMQATEIMLPATVVTSLITNVDVVNDFPFNGCVEGARRTVTERVKRKDMVKISWMGKDRMHEEETSLHSTTHQETLTKVKQRRKLNPGIPDDLALWIDDEILEWKRH